MEMLKYIYNIIVQQKIKSKSNEKFNEIVKMIKILDGIKKIKVNIEDVDYNFKYNYEKDEDVQDNKVERSNCDYE